MSHSILRNGLHRCQVNPPVGDFYHCFSLQPLYASELSHRIKTFCSVQQDVFVQSALQSGYLTFLANMHLQTVFALLAATLNAHAKPIAVPAPTPAPNLKDAVAKRATTCTFSGSNGYSQASVSKTSCATIVLDSLTVPSGVTLNLEKLNDGTTVSIPFPLLSKKDRLPESILTSGSAQVLFRGTTKWGYKEWEGSLFSVSGNRYVSIFGPFCTRIEREIADICKHNCERRARISLGRSRCSVVCFVHAQL